MVDDYQGGYAALAVVIEREMAERGMGLNEFARFTKLSPGTISNFVKKKGGNPDLPTIFALADALHIKEATLLGIAFPHRGFGPLPRLAYLLERMQVMSDRDRQIINGLADLLLASPALSEEIKVTLRLLSSY
jgi:transcriptional regulator with XRE-family HTH domain